MALRGKKPQDEKQEDRSIDINAQMQGSLSFKDPVNQAEFHMMIFSRWGEKVFDSKTQGQHWDGNYSRITTYPQAFMYVLDYRACDGNMRRKSGTVSVLK